MLLCITVVFGQDLKEDRMDIARSGSGQEKLDLKNQLLKETLDYSDEESFSNAILLLNVMGQQTTADSLVQVVVRDFPKGTFARRAYISSQINEKEDLKTKEKGFQNLLKKWPESAFPGDEIVYDYIRADLARENAALGNTQSALDYLQSMKERFWRAQGYSPVAGILLNQGDTALAMPLIQTSIEDAEYFIRIPEAEKTNKARFAAVGYPGYIEQMVDIYNNRGQQSQALALIERAIRIAPDLRERFSAVYYKGLLAAGRKVEALHQIESLYTNGDFSLEPALEDLYVDLNGNNKGFSTYKDGLQQETLVKIRKHIKDLKRNDPAPGFTLMDMQGNQVSLKDFRGKVVVLDFWATWCQPCKNSFPGMKATQLSYADDPEVKFLYVNTWERSKTYKEDVRRFIRENDYPFHVLFDDKTDPETGKNLAGEFGVQGIPAKFIIDKQGIIRYALTGSSSIAHYISLEMRELIESAKNQTPTE